MVSIDISEVRNEAIKLRPSVSVRIARSFFDMRKTTLELLAERPSEARLLLFVLLSDMIFILSWGLKTLISPTASAAQSMGADIALWLIVAMMLRTTAIYAMALVVGMITKLFGGQASLKDTRTGVFWGVFVAAPIGLLISELAVLINAFEGSFPILSAESIQMMPYWLGLVPFVWFVAKGAAAANRIENAVPIFGVISAIAVALAVAVKYLAI